MMKAKYTKPLLAFEMFSLTQPVTRDCAESIPHDRVNLNDPNNCVWDLGGNTTIFAENCSINGEAYGFFCYNNPSEDTLMFRS